jgi:hypothetical protein
MTSRKKEFRVLMKRQLDELHRRISELEALSPHSTEHAISWDTEIGDCRRKHLRTIDRLRDLEHHDEDSWHDTGVHIRDAVEDLERTVREREGVKQP